MKKILIINTTYDRGGAAKMASEIFLNLRSNENYNLFFAFGRGKSINDDFIFKFGNPIEFFLHILLVRFFGLEGFGSFFSTRKLIKFIINEKFDLIHLHNLHGYYLNFFYLFKWLNKKNIPIVWTIHDEWPFTWLPAHSMGCVHCQGGKGKCTNLYSYPKNYFPFFKKIMLKLKRELLNYKNINYIFPSPWLYEKFIYNHNTSNAVIIANGIDVEIFKPLNKNRLRIKYNLPLDKKIIIFSAANLKNKNKGMSYVLDAAKKLSDENILFIGIGSGKIYKLPFNVKMIGLINNKNILAEFYALSDLYFLSSLAESFSLTAYEALACGIPVVAFEMPATRFIAEKKLGLLSKKNIESIIENINVIVDGLTDYSPDKMRELVAFNYSLATMLKSYNKIYLEK